ncbi:mediator of RNA polymerase II transcription subunit 23-like isoform X1 [Amphibalanus amphitrite]|uniref:mediator of RNA polymerase II transcription subunit 23-like isoform X1 n=1 Tax=Amphibalanus amphitrite TaxID=1232801 RepID=UPI001C922484|nr:mediator of RNA polymerase II transcription subunit 23-like isoform X1 [Amphibalanus amphitrite]XP_043213333.1 mediator of RNA polymerase II transcription subunit 23-like isoform X1 [Amphibalanus amphitrite]XP_043213334.1 mediator of RNA polymerase II transcription subunit 23-like isoform X1 [Amphibalanus amphitrite]
MTSANPSLAKEKVAGLVNDFLCVEAVEEALNSYLVHHDENENSKLQTFEQELSRLLVSTQQEEQEQILLAFIGQVSEQSGKRMRKLLAVLERCVLSGALPAKLLCDNLLENKQLAVSRRDLWTETFLLLRRIVHKVDYKGVREIMKLCLDRARQLPADIGDDMSDQFHAIYGVIQHIFDREAALLPAYFIVNEIMRSYPDCKGFPHWKLAGLLEGFIGSFRSTAQMVTIMGRQYMLPIVEHAVQPANSWKLDPVTLRFQVKGNLPYERAVLQPQKALLMYIVRQPYSREMVCSVLGLQKQHKQRCPTLEDVLVDLIVTSMEQLEANTTDDFRERAAQLWQHISAQLIYFVVFYFADFSQLMLKLRTKLTGRKWDNSRDHLMWILLHYISGSISKNALSGFLPLLGLLKDLYAADAGAAPVPDWKRADAAIQMAAVSIWTHLQKKAQAEKVELPMRALPTALQPRLELLHQLAAMGRPTALERDFRLALVCNVENMQNVLTEAIMGGGQQRTTVSMPGTNCTASAPTQPLSMAMLDSLTIHAKMSLIHSISHHIKMAPQQHKMGGATVALPPALIETYSRLLVYPEIDTLGIKNLTSTLLPTVFKAQALGILHTLLEMFCCRLRHVQPHYRLTLLSTVHSLSNAPQTNHTQMHLCLESTALRIISGLGNSEIPAQLARFINEPKSIVSSDSEELNRALVLSIVRALHITGCDSRPGNDGVTGLVWCREILSAVLQATPHGWPRHTLERFPAPVRELFAQYGGQRDDKQQLKSMVNEEYRKYMSMNNENDIIGHFTIQGPQPFFVCLLWQMLLETNRITSIAYKVLERGGPKALTVHIRTFCDYLIHVLSTSTDGAFFKKCVDGVHKLVWTYNIVPIDRLILCLVLRPNEANELRLCSILIQRLMLTPPSEFIERVRKFVAENDPRYWEQDNWHEKHLAFHSAFPERFAPDDVLAEQQGKSAQTYQSLPVYFSNVCLRFLPVFDLMIQRFLECPHMLGDSIGLILDQMGSLYKFHERPVTFLYNTLHYYERPLSELPNIKRKLVTVVIQSQADVRPKGWCLTEEFETYLSSAPAAEERGDAPWRPQLDYYRRLLDRLVDTLAERPAFPSLEWRFNEFPNASAHALYCSCVELMALPVAPAEAVSSLLEVLLTGYVTVPRAQLSSWFNALGVLLAWLPEPYWRALTERVLSALSALPADADPFEELRLEARLAVLQCTEPLLLLAASHAFWNHATQGQIAALLAGLRTRLRETVRTETQFIYVCHLVAPFLDRLNTTSVFELTKTLYDMLEEVDRASGELRYIDEISDLLYHVKYMHTGDSTKAEAERVIRALRPALQLRLRFITHLNLDEIPGLDEQQQQQHHQLQQQQQQQQQHHQQQQQQQDQQQQQKQQQQQQQQPQHHQQHQQHQQSMLQPSPVSQ